MGASFTDDTTITNSVDGKSATIRSRGEQDSFVAKLKAADGEGVYIMDVGGSKMEYSWGMGLDASDRPIIAGQTLSPSLTFGTETRAPPLLWSAWRSARVS